MSAYSIMRVEKRGRGAVYGLQIEANRKEEDHEKESLSGQISTGARQMKIFF